MEHLSKYFFVGLLAFVLSCSRSTKKENTAHEISFEDLFESEGFIDLDSLRNESIIQEKPVLLYFTGINVGSFRKWENQIFKHPEVISRLSEDFLFEPVYVDDKSPLPKNVKIPSCNLLKSPIETIGDANMCLQIELCNSTTQPYLLALDSRKRTIGEGTYESIRNLNDFSEFLEKTEKSFRRKS